jgi:hypothetical protein
MNSGDLYDWILWAVDKPAAVAVLHDESLCALSGWLSRHYEENAPSGELLGLCLVESARRFSLRVQGWKNTQGRGQDVPATI